jgi:uncharacterized membrane protein
MDPISIEEIKAIRKYRRSRRQQKQKLLPTLTPYMVATCVLCLLLTSPAWFPKLCSLLISFLTTLPDLATAFLLSPKCLFVVGNLIVAFLINESRLAPRSPPASLVDVDGIHEEHVKRNVTSTTTTTVVFTDQSAQVGVVWEGEEEEEEEQGEEELEKRVDDFIARVRRQRKLEATSFFVTDR